MYTDEECPTCGSDMPDMPYVGHFDSEGEWSRCDECGNVLCPDESHGPYLIQREL